MSVNKMTDTSVVLAERCLFLQLGCGVAVSTFATGLWLTTLQTARYLVDEEIDHFEVQVNTQINQPIGNRITREEWQCEFAPQYVRPEPRDPRKIGNRV
jgi:hypothetical protein